MKTLKIILTNGYILIIPILLWNILLYDKLPTPYLPENFNQGIAQWVLIAETVFRTVIFALPLFVYMTLKSKTAKIGIGLYITGSLLYYGSWAALIWASESMWSHSIRGFTAPAYTTIVWLIGLALATKSYIPKLKTRQIYILCSIIFLIFHTLHAALIYLT